MSGGIMPVNGDLLKVGTRHSALGSPDADCRLVLLTADWYC